MVERLANVIYWTATSLAVLTAVFFTALAIQDQNGSWGLFFMGLVVAAIIWAAGKAARYILSNR